MKIYIKPESKSIAFFAQEICAASDERTLNFYQCVGNKEQFSHDNAWDCSEWTGEGDAED